MVELAAGQARVVAPLFKDFSDTLIWSYLQGHFGGGWADDPNAPSCAVIRVRDFVFVAGDVSAADDERLMRAIGDRFTLLVPENDAWGALVKRLYGERCAVITRYAIKREPDCFDRARLEALVRALPEGFRLARIDEALYTRIMSEPDLEDFCASFDDAADYLRRGIGFVALTGDGDIAAGASSFTMYDGGIEIEVDTREPYRRRGLAAACSAALILACLDAGLYPSWDAANMASVQLAEKLGYHADKPYDTYMIRV